MKKAFYPATTLHGRVTLPFVIPTIPNLLRQVEGRMNNAKVDCGECKCHK